MMTLANALRAVLILILLLGIAAMLQSRQMADVSGEARVLDGDSLTILGERIRLVGLDAPEFNQICQDEKGRDWPCGREARSFLAREAGRGVVTCTVSGQDRYDRSLAECLTGERNLGAALVAAGLAIATEDYFAEEAQARKARLGLWRGRFDTPAEWRKTPAVVGSEL